MGEAVFGRAGAPGEPGVPTPRRAERSSTRSTPGDRETRLRRLAQMMETYSDPSHGAVERERERAFDKQVAAIKDRCGQLLDHRMRSRKELVDKLHTLAEKKNWTREAIAQAVNDLERVGLVDDALFASEWVRQRRHKGKARRVLDAELREKGISQSIRESVLASISEEDEYEQAAALATKRIARLAAAPESRDEYVAHLRKLVGYLARRGYSQGVCMDVGRQALDARIDEVSF